jgi:hypothetical protein
MESTQASRYSSALKTSQERYAQMIAEANAAKQTAATEIAPELTQTADMYAAGGTYGSGQRALVEENLKAGSSKEQAALVSSGMSSGSMAAGVTSRYARNRATEFANIEDTRTDKLTTALSAVAAAKEARTGRMTSAYTTSAQLIQGFKDPTVGEFESAEELQAAENASKKQLLGMQLTADESNLVKKLNASLQETKLQTSSQDWSTALNYQLGKSKIQAESELQSQVLQFQAEQNAKYKLTADQQLASKFI